MSVNTTKSLFAIEPPGKLVSNMLNCAGCPADSHVLHLTYNTYSASQHSQADTSASFETSNVQTPPGGSWFGVPAAYGATTKH